MRFKKLLTSVITASMLATSVPYYNITSAEVIMPEPIMKVTFDEGNAVDVTGRGNDGKVVGSPEFVKGIKGKAIHLVNPEGVAGTSKKAEQYVDFGEKEDLKFGEEDFSIAFWYKSSPEQSREGSIVSNKDWNTGNNPGFNIGNMKQGVNLNFNTPGNSGRAETDRFSSATDGGWHHVVAVVDRDDKMTLYIDGKEASGGAGHQSGSSTVSIKDRKGTIDVLNFVLGADGKFENSVLDSYIDELEVYKTVLTKDEIIELGKYEKEPMEGPVLQVTFDDEGATDISGNENNGVVVGSPEFVEGISGKAIRLQNPEGVAGEYVTANQYVDFGNEEGLKLGKDDFSIMFWYKANGNDSEEVSIISNKDWYTGGNPGFAIGDMRNGATLNFTANGGSRADTGRVGEATDNKWHHIAATFNRTGNMILYVDGKNTTSKNISNQVGKSIDVTNLILGADGTKRYGVKDSYIDELVIYKSVVTESEIAEINAPYILQNKIAEYEKLVEESTASPEKIEKFKLELSRIKVESEGVTDLEEIERFNKELKIAFNEFSGPEKGIIEFEVISDVHITSDNEETKNSVNFIDAINDVKEFFPDSLGIMGAGDYTDSGNENQYKGYANILNNYGQGLEFLNPLGNHDVRWKSGWDEVYNRYMKYNKDYMGETNGKVYHNKWIDGYNFIALNTEWDIKDRAYISPEQLEWLDKTMAEGAEEGKPIFIFLHQAMRDTYWNSNDWEVGIQDFALKEVLRKYPQTVMFTGHIHNGLGALDVVKTDYGTMVDVPSFYYNDYGDGRGQLGYHVTVNEDTIQLSMRDYKNDEWMPEHNFTIDLNPENYLPGKVLDVNFDDETANDNSGRGNDGTLVGNPEFVEGINGGKAIKITNPKEIAGKEVTAEQYVDFGENLDLKFGEDDFSILFWYKSDAEIEGEGSIISNKNWSTGGNKGFTIGSFTGERPGLGLNFNTEGGNRVDTDRFDNVTDGKWHQISSTFDRDGNMVLYIDGKEVNRRDISDKLGQDIDVEGLSLVLGADGNKMFGLSDAVIDELKIYKKVIGAAELETVCTPYTLEVGETEATITWELPENESLEPAYIVVNGKKYADIASGETSAKITGLNPNEEYTVLLVNREKQYKGNYKDVYPFVFTTKSPEEIKVEKPQNLNAKEVTNKSVTLTWEEPSSKVGLEGYIIYKDGKEIGLVENTEYTVDGLKANTITSFKVVSKYSNGEKSKPVSINVRTTK
ncbi:LamG-like jellyroll fold domain-containing protein [Clostridium sp.]|uniref:LamG-like jellyroll fold domain-containing protein n=1 Tax=Clostridium sp. TaxID=1506 RepID=UPI003F2E58CE